MTRELPVEGTTLRLAELASYESSEVETLATVDDANIICSDVATRPGWHKILLDVDLPIKVVRSSSEGHGHLYIDHEVTWDEYLRLLWVLTDMGIVEEGYAERTQNRGYAALRVPWVHKDSCECMACEAEIEDMEREILRNRREMGLT